MTGGPKNGPAGVLSVVGAVFAGRPGTASRTTIDHGPCDPLDRRRGEGHAPEGSFLHASISEMRARSPSDARYTGSCRVWA